MKLFNFGKIEKKPKINKSYENFGGEFVDDNTWSFSPELILEKKENLPRFLYRGVKNKGVISNINTALDSLNKINDREDSLVNWQTESISTTEDKNIAFGYALEGEISNKLDLYDKLGNRIFEFLNDNKGRWLLDHYPERLVNITEDGEVKIDWDKAKEVALKLLEDQIELTKTFLIQDKETLKNLVNKYGYDNDDRHINLIRNQIIERENKTSDKNIKHEKELIESMNSDNVEFRIDGEIKDVCLGYLFELEPKEKVHIATRKSVENFMKHYNIGQTINPGKAKSGSSKELLTNLMKNAEFNGIDKNSEEKEIGFFDPKDLKPVFGLEIKIINGKLITEKHIFNQ